MRTPIYLDHHATTPVDQRVLEAMLPYFSENFGNAASRNHAFGWKAAEAVKRAREQAAALIGANVREIVFTSGATESNNLALKGAVQANRERGCHIITTVTEHKAVLDPVARLEREGCRVSRLPVGSDGLLEPSEVEQALTPETVLVSVLYANNEIGVIQPISEIGRLVRAHGALFHTDAAQAAGKISVDVDGDAIDLLSLTAHKLYGPKGAGVLYVRRRGRRAEITQQIDGGGHERGLRSGTLNVPGIVGLGKACEIAAMEMDADAARLGALRDRLLERLSGKLDGVHVNGSPQQRLAHNLNVSFAGVDGESLLRGLTDIAVSSGSACTSNNPEPSHVLRAIGAPRELVQASLRFGLGRSTTAAEIEFAADRVVAVVRRLRQMSAS